MNALGRNYTFFDSKQKFKKPQSNHHSRSMSSRSDFGKKSSRLNAAAPKPPPLSQKEKQIREAIKYRFAKSKIRDFKYEPTSSRVSARRSLSRSSQEQEFKELKGLKYVNLKDYHLNAEKKKLKEQETNRMRSKFKLRTEGSMIIKTEGSEPSIEKFKALNPYLRHNKKAKGEDWRFISIQFKERSKSKTREVKVNSHRTLTAEIKSTEKMKSVDSRWTNSKLKDLGKLGKKYRM